jgi:hypothetical protein
MGYVDIADNQTVSFNNLQNAVSIGLFQQKTTIPAGTEGITKTDADTYVVIDTAYAPYAAKASNQLVVKSNLKPVFQNSATFYYSSVKARWEGWTSSSTACSSYSGGLSSTIYWNGSFTAGTQIFTTFPLFQVGGSSSGIYFVVVISGTAYWFTVNDWTFYDSASGTYAATINATGTCGNPVTNLQGSYYLDISDYYVTADVTVTSAVTVDTQFDVVVSTSGAGDINVTVTILNGQTTGSGQTFVGVTDPVSVTATCINSCDNPAITFVGYSC